MVWDNAMRHVSQAVRRWRQQHNQQVEQTGTGGRLPLCPPPTKAASLNHHRAEEGAWQAGGGRAGPHAQWGGTAGPRAGPLPRHPARAPRPSPEGRLNLHQVGEYGTRRNQPTGSCSGGAGGAMEVNARPILCLRRAIESPCV